ncbi:hypothetical protein Hanom_Chr01g00012541 [Helianthus anomalus]
MTIPTVKVFVYMCRRLDPNLSSIQRLDLRESSDLCCYKLQKRDFSLLSLP